MKIKLVLFVVALVTILHAPMVSSAATTNSPKPYKLTTGSLFNYPKGAYTKQRPIYLKDQYAHVRQAIGVLDAMPKGSNFTAATLNIDLSSQVGAQQDMLSALKRAHNRGVNVKVILCHCRQNTKIEALKKHLGTNTKARSFVKVCQGSCFESEGRGSQHSKFWTADKFLKPGGGYTYYAFNIGSYNWTGSTHDGSWNQSQTLTDRKLYNALIGYHKLMIRDAPYKNYPNARSGNYQIIFSPNSKDVVPTVMNTRAVNCKAAPGYGVGGRTVVKMAIFTITGTRMDLARELVRLHRNKCIVNAYINTASSRHSVTQYLVRSGVPTWDMHYTPKGKVPIYGHDKWLSINGTINGKGRATILQGSHNYTNAAWRTNNEVIFQTINSKSELKKYNDWLVFRQPWNERITDPNKPQEPMLTKEKLN